VETAKPAPLRHLGVLACCGAFACCLLQQHAACAAAGSLLCGGVRGVHAQAQTLSRTPSKNVSSKNRLSPDPAADAAALPVEGLRDALDAHARAVLAGCLARSVY
jgi:hypothetical protein